MMPAFDIQAFDPEFAGPGDWAAMYRAHGLQIVPSMLPSEAKPGETWKRPVVKWRDDKLQDELMPDFTFERWYGPNGEFSRRAQMGIVAGRASGNVFVIDLDDYKQQGARHWWQNLLHTWNGGDEIETWQQVTGGGGRQLFFRAPLGWHAPTNRTPIGVDIRGQGGFAVLPPSLHESGKEYRWQVGCEPWTLLDGPAKAPAWLLEAVEQLVAAHGGDSGRTRIERPESPGGDFDAFGARVDGREDYMTRVVWGAVVDWYRECPITPPSFESHAKCAAVYELYERGVKSRLPGSTTEGLEAEGRGPTAFAEKWRRAMAQWDTKVWQASKEPPPKAEGTAGPASFQGQVAEPKVDASLICAEPFPWIDPSSIPPRKWVYNRHKIRQFVSSTVAPGGVGKSSLEIVELLAIATGRPLLSVIPDERCAVWYFNGEDPADELKRRIMAAAVRYGLRPEELEGRFFVNTGRLTPIIVAERTRDGVVINAPVVQAVIDAIIANKIGVLSIDPFVSCHRVTENDNAEIERVAKVWTHIAEQTGCAIELVHHVRKTNGAEVGVEDGRGAVALLAAARAARAINRMTPDEGARAGVPDPQFYFRADNGKANLAPPASAQWFHLTAIDLDNDTPDSDPPRPSDKVGVVEPWEWPDFAAGVTGSDVDEVLRRLRASPTRYRADSQAADWIGKLIMEVLGVDSANPSSRAQAKHLQKQWTQTGALKEVAGVDAARRSKQFIEAGE